MLRNFEVFLLPNDIESMAIEWWNYFLQSATLQMLMDIGRWLTLGFKEIEVDSLKYPMTTLSGYWIS
jgi:hypothetical protein